MELRITAPKSGWRRDTIAPAGSGQTLPLSAPYCSIEVAHPANPEWAVEVMIRRRRRALEVVSAIVFNPATNEAIGPFGGDVIIER